MPREKPDYRSNMELINAMFPGRMALNYEEICKIFNCSRSTAVRHWKNYYNKLCGGVPISTIARLMCA